MLLYKKYWRTALAGLCAGAINGLFGAGGGMVLVPLLVMLTDLKEEEIFPASVSIILPICMVSLIFSRDWSAFSTRLPWTLLGGSILGGVSAGFWGKYIPTIWLHRILGILILWGGIRYLC